MTQLRDAIRIAKSGDLAQALTATNEIVDAHPTFQPAVKFKGALLEQLGRGEESAAAYQAALKLDPKDSELLYKLGVYQLVVGRPAEAIALFKRELALVPEDGDTLFYLAQAYHLHGEDDLALETIKECVRVTPNDPSVWQKYGEMLCSSGDNTAGITWLTKAQQADSTLDRIDFDLAVASYNNMDLTSATQYVTKAVALHPEDPKALDLQAQVDSKLGNWQDAKPIFEHLLALKNDDDSATLGLAHADLELKQYAAAANVLEGLLQRDPTLILAHYYLSRAYVGLGRTADAQHEAELHGKMLEQANSLAPAAETAAERKIMVTARQFLQDRKEAEALQLFRETAKGPYATPGAPSMLVGALYLYLGRPDDAERSLNKALTIEPKVQGAHTYLGMLWLQQANFDKADGEFAKELSERPNYALALEELGEVRYRQQRWNDAVDLLVRSKTTVPSLLYMLCDSYFRLGQVKEADLTAELLSDYGRGDHDMLRSVVDLLNRNQQKELAQKISSKAGL